jgi:hypothetical protein
MRFLPLLIAVALLVLAVAFGIHCLVLHCDKPKHPRPARRRDSN